MIFLNHILGVMKFEVHLQNFSKVLTSAGCGGAIYLGVSREASRIFYDMILFLQGLIY